MTMQGADVARLRQLAKRFDSSATQLQQLTVQLTAKINATQSWQGSDATRFRSDWNGKYRTLINQSTTVLHDGSQALAKNAAEQERASNGAGAGGSVGGGIGAGVGVGVGAGITGIAGGLLETMKTITSGNIVQETRGYVSKAITATKLGYALKFKTLTKPLEVAVDAGGKFAKFVTGLEEVNNGKFADKVIGLLGKEGSLAGRLSELGPFAKGLKGLGIVGGGIGVVTGGIGLYQGIKSGDTHKAVDGGLDMLSGGLGIAAAVTPPPADLILGAGALAVWGGKEIYDHWDDITEFAGNVGDGIQHAGESVVHGVENAGKAIGDAAEDVGHALNPANW